MRKQVTNKLLSVVFGALAVMGIACTSSDINEVYEGPTVNAGDNPLSDLTPSASFTWSTMAQSRVTIEVDDRFDGQYDYYVNLYADNPAVPNKPNALFSGVARANNPATCEVELPSSTTHVYVQVTDPQGYVMTYGYAAPKQGAAITLPCVIGEPAQGDVKEIDTPSPETKAAFNPYFELPDAVTAPTMDWSIPGDAVVLPDATQNDITAVYKVPANTTVTFTEARQVKPAEGGKVRIVVEGTLDMQNYSLTLVNDAELYVKEGGQVTGQQLILQQNCVLATEEGAELEVEKVTALGNAYFYNAGEAYITNQLNFNVADANIYVAPTGQIIGAAKGSQALADNNFTMDFSALQGQLYIDANETNSGQFLCGSVTNEVTTAEYVVGENAHMHITGDMNFKCPVYNAGLFRVSTINGGSVSSAKIYNACTMIVKQAIKQVGTTIVKSGTISGGVSVDGEGNLEFSPVPSFYYPSGWGTYLYLLDGSFIDIQDWNVGYALAYGYEWTDNTGGSLMRVRGSIANMLFLNNNLVLEYDALNVQGMVMYAYGTGNAHLFTTSIDIDTCTGNIPTREVNEDDEIVQPDPYVGSALSNYTVNFEDQWPVIGDYDVNDIVLHIGNIETSQTSSKVQEANFELELKAVGAGYLLGVGLQLDNITNAEIASVDYSLNNHPGMQSSDKGAFTLGSNGAETGNASDPAVLPICYDAHKVFLNTATLDDSQRKPLNTSSSRELGTSITIHVVFADNANVTPEDLMVSALNFFIFRPEDEAAIDGKRVEVHMKGYAPTRLATDVYFGEGNDNSSTGNYYVSKDGFPWGIIVSDIDSNAGKTPWTWPIENRLITSEYNRFGAWVNSDGLLEVNWMVIE